MSADRTPPPVSPTTPVTLWGPPANPAPAKTRQASLWDVAIGYIGIIFIPSLILLPVALYVAYQSTGDATDPQALTTATDAALKSTGWLVVAGLALQWAILLFAVWLGGRKTDGGWRTLVKWDVKWRKDLLVAVGFTVTLVAAQIVARLLLIGLFGIDTNNLGNTDIVTDMKGAWLAVIILCATVGAPIVEELFFRGLFFNVTRRKWNVPVAVIVSSLAFGLLHAQGTVASTIYTVASTTIVGACLALLYWKTNRIGTNILSHMVFNITGVALALLAIQS